MKVISRQSTIEFTDEVKNETIVLLKDDPMAMEYLKETLKQYLKGSPVKPKLNCYRDELLNAIVIDGGE